MQAIHRLFARRRTAGIVLTLSAVGAYLALAASRLPRRATPKARGSGGYGWNPGTTHFGFGGFAIIWGALAAPVMGVAIQRLIAYGPKREANVVAAYETTRKLPPKSTAGICARPGAMAPLQNY